jgi:hypothetical protein
MNTGEQRAPTCGTHDTQIAICCLIGCDRKATKLIYPREGIFYDAYTHSCDEHVEDMKSNEDDIVESL